MYLILLLTTLLPLVMCTLKRIIDLHQNLIDELGSNIAFKLCHGTHLIFMEKLPDTITNEDRRYVFDMSCAKFRANKLRVRLIVNITNLDDVSNLVINTYADYNTHSTVCYQTNRIVEPDDFDNNIEVVCSSGIHYFKSIEPAFNYNRDYLNEIDGLNCVWKQWHDNGDPMKEIRIVNGVADGIYREWFANGILKLEYNYVDGKLEGVQKEWHHNEQLKADFMMITGNLITYKQWHDNGCLYIERSYKNGQFHGKYRCWNFDGDLIEDSNYVEGVLIH